MSTDPKKPGQGISIASTTVDVVAQEDGVWVETDTLGEGVAFHVRSLHCKAYRRMQSRVGKRTTQKIIRGGEVDPIHQDLLTARCFAETIVVPDSTGIAWRGLHDENGDDIPYDKETAFEWLSNPAYRRVADAIAWAAAGVGEREEEHDRQLGEA